jgi:hypothetical protein
MKQCFSLLLVMVSMTACGNSDQASSTVQNLNENLLNTYKPLESCLNERLGGIVTDKAASAIVVANKLSELNREAVNLLPPDNPELLTALKELEAEKKAFSLLSALVGYRDVKIQNKAVIESYGLLREVAAANVLSTIDNVNCPQPEFLEYWQRESERQQIFLDSQNEVFGLTECVKGSDGKYSGDWVRVIVDSGKLDELEFLAARVMGDDNPELQFVMQEKNPEQKTQQLISILVRFYAEDRLPDQSYEITIRQILGMNGLKSIYAQAINIDCKLPEPNWQTVAWKYIEDHPLAANPSPFTTNNKADTP